MSELRTLTQVLQDKLLNVADYQRPYAWEEKQLSDLWADIDLLGTQAHYTGTLVLQNMGVTETTRSGEALMRFDVVDGQQRLTTCVILLNRLSRALRDFGAEESQEAAGDLRRLLLVNLGGVPTPRLSLANDLERFFADSVLGNEAPESTHLALAQRRLLAAASFFDARIDELVADVGEGDAVRRLLQLRARACYQLQFMVYSVDRMDEVGVLFETVNSRGKGLSELERVKNYLLYLSRQLGEKQRDSVAMNINRSWSAIFDHLGRVGLRDDTLLRAHWLVTQDANTRNWRGANSVKAKFPRSRYVSGSSRLAGGGFDEIAGDEHGDALFGSLTSYVDSLRKSAVILARVHDSADDYDDFEEHGPAIRERTAALRRSGSMASFYPILLAARLAHSHDRELYRRIVEYCERFSARVWAIRGLRSNAGESSIRWSARDLFTGKSPGEVLIALDTRLWQLAPDDAVSASFAANEQWYPRATAHKFVLYEYELSRQRDGSDIPEFGAMTARGNKTTEHILPQNPAPDSRWWDSFTKEEHARLVHGIGNLVLTRDNSRYGNRDYLDSPTCRGKRGAAGQSEPWCYFNRANLAREREIAEDYEQWTPESIERRARDIADWALTRWPASQPGRPIGEDASDDRLVEDEYEDDENGDVSDAG